MEHEQANPDRRPRPTPLGSITAVARWLWHKIVTGNLYPCQQQEALMVVGVVRLPTRARN